ncbi:MAG: hypothetical protein Q8M92_03750 [Candidatus Subteraquimicrobiales bacterium]|nr:hypothetical protein [Candidatus Subteraquimicrobiales bacterium]
MAGALDVPADCPAKTKGCRKPTRQEKFRARLEEVMIEVRKEVPLIDRNAPWFKAEVCW